MMITDAVYIDGLSTDARRLVLILRNFSPPEDYKLYSVGDRRSSLQTHGALECGHDYVPLCANGNIVARRKIQLQNSFGFDDRDRPSGT